VSQAGLLRPGDIGIRALVRARLLGLQILTLDAQVVVAKGHAEAVSRALLDPEERRPGRSAALSLASAPPPSAPPVAAPPPAALSLAALPLAAPRRAGEAWPSQGRRIPDPSSGNRLARAAVLLEQGAQTLEHSRDLASW
jgi:hypothetical protein